MPKGIYSGGSASDSRGTITFVNEFNFSNIKRFYQIQNKNTSIIRAFHGHMVEEKYVYAVKGSLLLCTVKLTNTQNPSKKVKVNRFILSSAKPQIIHIPAGYANGIRSLERNSIIIFYSTSTLEESKKDDFRYPYDYWGEDVWNIKAL